MNDPAWSNKWRTPLAGLEPPAKTPPKLENATSQVKYAHALVKHDHDGAVYECLACSSKASGMAALEALPCVPLEKQKYLLQERMQEERAKLEKLRTLRLLELEMHRLEQLKKQRDLAQDTAARAPSKQLAPAKGFRLSSPRVSVYTRRHTHTNTV